MKCNQYRYIILDIDDNKREEWDNAVRKADEKFGAEEHDLVKFEILYIFFGLTKNCLFCYFFSNNCHHHVAEVLNQIQYQGKSNWGLFGIWWLLIKKSKYVR